MLAPFLSHLSVAVSKNLAPSADAAAPSVHKVTLALIRQLADTTVTPTTDPTSIPILTSLAQLLGASSTAYRNRAEALAGGSAWVAALGHPAELDGLEPFGRACVAALAGPDVDAQESAARASVTLLKCHGLSDTIIGDLIVRLDARLVGEGTRLTAVKGLQQALPWMDPEACTRMCTTCAPFLRQSNRQLRLAVLDLLYDVLVLKQDAAASLVASLLAIPDSPLQTCWDVYDVRVSTQAVRVLAALVQHRGVQDVGLFLPMMLPIVTADTRSVDLDVALRTLFYYVRFRLAPDQRDAAEAELYMLGRAASPAGEAQGRVARCLVSLVDEGRPRESLFEALTTEAANSSLPVASRTLALATLGELAHSTTTTTTTTTTSILELRRGDLDAKVRLAAAMAEGRRLGGNLAERGGEFLALLGEDYPNHQVQHGPGEIFLILTALREALTSPVVSVEGQDVALRGEIMRLALRCVTAWPQDTSLRGLVPDLLERAVWGAAGSAEDGTRGEAEPNVGLLTGLTGPARSGDVVAPEARMCCLVALRQLLSSESGTPTHHESVARAAASVLGPLLVVRGDDEEGQGVSEHPDVLAATLQLLRAFMVSKPEALLADLSPGGGDVSTATDLRSLLVAVCDRCCAVPEKFIVTKLVEGVMTLTRDPAQPVRIAALACLDAAMGQHLVPPSLAPQVLAAVAAGCVWNRVVGTAQFDVILPAHDLVEKAAAGGLPDAAWQPRTDDSQTQVSSVRMIAESLLMVLKAKSPSSAVQAEHDRYFGMHKSAARVLVLLQSSLHGSGVDGYDVFAACETALRSEAHLEGVREALARGDQGGEGGESRAMER